MTLPRGRAAWAMYVLILVILTASSAAPFIQLGSGVPRLSADDLATTALYVATWIPLLGSVIWLLRLFRGGAAWIAHVILVLVIPAAHTSAFTIAFDALRGASVSVIESLSSPAFQVLTLLGTLQYLVLLAVAIAVSSGMAADRDHARATSLELAQSVLKEQLMAARLEALTAQLRPHFLFNTLNSISVLATTDPPAAQSMIRQLSALLRATLANGHPLIPLSAEVRVLESYVAIQKMRFGERLAVLMAIDSTAADCEVPALLLQPLVENAVEHGIADSARGGTINVTAIRNNGRVKLQVADDGQGRHTDRFDVNHFGLGLANTCERLQRLYGPEHRFDVDYPTGGGCCVTIEIPAKYSDRSVI